MCEMGNIKVVSLQGSGRGAEGWFPLGAAQVYHDHFYVAQLEEGIVIDFLDEKTGEPLRICLEMSAESANGLAQAITETLEAHKLRREASRALKEVAKS